MKETTDVQNTLARLYGEVYLNVDEPTTKIKIQYQKALIALSNAIHQFDLLNDFKEDLKEERTNA